MYPITPSYCSRLNSISSAVKSAKMRRLEVGIVVLARTAGERGIERKGAGGTKGW
jgi:hypothetical protein